MGGKFERLKGMALHKHIIVLLTFHTRNKPLCSLRKIILLQKYNYPSSISNVLFVCNELKAEY